MDPRPSPRILRRDIVQKPIATPPNITTMINAVLVFNNAGQPRLTKFYTQLETSVQQRLISEIFTLVANRPDEFHSFLQADIAKWAEVVRMTGATID